MLRRSDRGAAAVEFGLVLPLLLLLVLGIAEFGRAWYVNATLAGAAREAVREMAIHNDPGAAQARAVGYAPGLGLSASQVTFSPAKCPTTGPIGTTNITVTITYHYDSLTGVVPGGIDMIGRGTMRCNG